MQRSQKQKMQGIHFARKGESGEKRAEANCVKSRHLDGDWSNEFEWQSPKNDNVASGQDGVACG